MWKRILPIDYEALTDYLLEQHRLAAMDMPVEPLTFQEIKNTLIEHAEVMMEENDYSVEDNELTALLFRHHMFGSVKDVRITSEVGTVTFRDGHLLKLPLVIIELEI